MCTNMEESQKKIEEKVQQQQQRRKNEIHSHTQHKLCYNNQIDNNNFVKTELVVVFFTLVDERISDP